MRITVRIGALSMPMPNARVATTTCSLPLMNATCTAPRSSVGMPAWYGAAVIYYPSHYYSEYYYNYGYPYSHNHSNYWYYGNGYNYYCRYYWYPRYDRPQGIRLLTPCAPSLRRRLHRPGRRLPIRACVDCR